MNESQIQRALVNHFKARGVPGCVMFAVPNGGSRHPFEAANLKYQGVLSGVPDLVIAAHGKTYALELKTPKGRVSERQRHVLHQLEGAGWICFVAYGLNEALQALEHWGVLQGNMTSPTTLPPRGQTAASANAGRLSICGNE